MKRLKKERDLVERQLTGLNAALAAFVGLYGGSQVTGKRKVSVAARRTSLAQKALWAKGQADGKEGSIGRPSLKVRQVIGPQAWCTRP